MTPSHPARTPVTPPSAASAHVPAAAAAALATRAESRRPSWVELSVALTALVVSIGSLLVARHQAQVMDRQLAATVWPLLSVVLAYAYASAVAVSDDRPEARAEVAG